MAKIDYQLLLDNALKSVVKDALIYAQINGLGDGSHFFITFKTRDAGVQLPDFLRMRYPDIMTIVLQYSYTNLHVSDKEFGVQLTFDGRPFFIRVPFSALVEFKDPSVDFILTFQHKSSPDAADNDMELPLDENKNSVPDDKRVVSLDEFRKKCEADLLVTGHYLLKISARKSGSPKKLYEQRYVHKFAHSAALRNSPRYAHLVGVFL